MQTAFRERYFPSAAQTYSLPLPLQAPAHRMRGHIQKAAQRWAAL